MNWVLPAAVLISIALGLLAPALHRSFGSRVGKVLSLWPFALFLYFIGLAPRIAGGEVLRASYRWFTLPAQWLSASGRVDGLDINFGFTLDGLSLLFLLLVTGVGAFVLFYAGSYLSPDEEQSKFFAYLMLFVGAMVGVVTADNLFALYMFWEATSFTSFLLIGFWSHRDESRQGALKALLVTAGGGLALLAGSVLMLVTVGSADLTDLLVGRDALHGSPLYPAMLLLVLLGAFTKSAQAPFHLWLPNAMEAPTPVSAYLHSAAMVKAGIYLIARMSPVLGGSGLWVLVVSLVGIVSLVLGSYLALRQTDLKAILAFSTISQLGLIIALFGWSTPLAVTAGIFHILNHSVFKAALFMMVGIVDHETGTRDVRALRGLGAAMPITAGIALVGGLALAGVPPLNGFISKEMFFTASLELTDVLAGLPGGPVLEWLFPVLAVLGSTLTFVYSLKISHGIFYRRGGAWGGGDVRDGSVLMPKNAAEPAVGLWLAPGLLAVLAVLLGVAPGFVDGAVVASAANVVLGKAAAAPLALWHGFNVPLAMSLGVIAVGFVLYVRVDAVGKALARIPTRLNVNALYDWFLESLTAVSEFVEARLLTGFTRDYVAWLLGFLLVLLTFNVGRTGFFTLQLDWPPEGTLQWAELLLAVLIAGITLCLPFMRSRVAAVISLGAIGTSLVMLWTLFGAPDLALSMLVVETVGLMLFLLVFVFLPRLRKDVFPAGARWVNVLIAGGAGVAVTLLLLGARGLRDSRVISDWYIENSLPLAHGTNIVNVILVDFRGYDTLFEITVLALAGLGVYILSNLRYKGGRK